MISASDGTLSNRDERWIKRAAALAKPGTTRSAHGAIVVAGGRAVGMGINTSRTHGTWQTGIPRALCSLHAEMSALRRCRSRVRTTVYVVRVNKRGMWKGSAPCKRCMDGLIAAGVKRVVHT